MDQLPGGVIGECSFQIKEVYDDSCIFLLFALLHLYFPSVCLFRPCAVIPLVKAGTFPCPLAWNIWILPLLSLLSGCSLLLLLYIKKWLMMPSYKDSFCLTDHNGHLLKILTIWPGPSGRCACVCGGERGLGLGNRRGWLQQNSQRASEVAPKLWCIFEIWC